MYHYLALISWLGYHLVVQPFSFAFFIYKYKRQFSRILEKYCFILKMIGCLLCFFIARNNGSLLSPVSQKFLLSFSIFNVFTMIPKNELRVSAIFALSVKTLPRWTNVILLFLDPFFSVKSEDTVFQNNLLSVILLRFKFSKYCPFFLLQQFYAMVALLSICKPIFFGFEFQKFITKLRPNHDCLIKFLKFF